MFGILTIWLTGRTERTKKFMRLNPPVLRRILYASVVIAVIAAAAIVFGSRNPAGLSAKSRVQITVATPRLPFSSLLYIAQAEGLLSREGVDVTWLTSATGKDALDLVLAGKADLATVATLPLSQAITHQASPRILATIAGTSHDNAIVARTDRGIANAAGLEGKTIGVPLGTGAQFYLEAVLIDAGVNPEKVTLVDLPPAACVESLASGKVDAISIFSPWWHRASQALGPAGIKFTPELYVSHWNLVTAGPVTARKADASVRLLRALRAAESFISSQPDRALATVAEAISLPPSELAAHWKDYSFHVHLPQSLVVALENEVRWARARGLSDRAAPMPNFLDYIDLRPLRGVDATSVKITQ